MLILNCLIRVIATVEHFADAQCWRPIFSNATYYSSITTASDSSTIFQCVWQITLHTAYCVYSSCCYVIGRLCCNVKATADEWWILLYVAAYVDSIVSVIVTMAMEVLKTATVKSKTTSLTATVARTKEMMTIMIMMIMLLP